MCFLELEETTWADWKECLVVEVALVVEVSRLPPRPAKKGNIWSCTARPVLSPGIVIDVRHRR